MSGLFLKLRSVPSRSHGVDHRFCSWQGNLKWSAGAARFKSTGGLTLWFQSSRTLKSASGTLLLQFGSRRCAWLSAAVAALAQISPAPGRFFSALEVCFREVVQAGPRSSSARWARQTWIRANTWATAITQGVAFEYKVLETAN